MGAASAPTSASSRRPSGYSTLADQFTDYGRARAGLGCLSVGHDGEAAWASHAKARAAVVPACAGDAQCPDGHADSRGGTEKAPAGERRSKRYAWAKLMARAFAIDVLCCAKCGSRMQRIAFVTRPASIRAVLSSVGLPADAPEPAPARRDGQQDLFAVA